MPRTTNSPASRKRRKRRLDQAKGFYGSRSKLFRQATEAVDRAMALSYAHRKEKKRDFRGLWIVRLSAACKLNEISYSRFIEGLTKAGVELNRKMLSEIAIHDPEGFASLAALAKSKATIPAKAK
ncbi:MAG: 50S ribosomal protein L20 [Kiritimatiellae bacterium]|jgi:large subunit ribosomal protein L20|nr:50S ribosomal protein L20 [Kiritimatiellia bacterium]NCC92739.1 50S ribosomal protein L20 [Opitutae bacterium]MDD4117457.1 50S ribosomal protein L20 [Kiritimatiellia bacterium]HOO21230.1 50S ribosomal protein L20 [Kiritimatiellia bacterium]HPJ56867.1 50S ribosomal protein L20 [Kiritimatiellia bacterium]